MASKRKTSILSILVLLTVSLIAYAIYGSFGKTTPTPTTASNSNKVDKPTDEPNKNKPVVCSIAEAIKLIEGKAETAKKDLEGALAGFKLANGGKGLDLTEDSEANALVIKAFEEEHKDEVELLKMLKAYLDKEKAHRDILAIKLRADAYTAARTIVDGLKKKKDDAATNLTKITETKDQRLQELTKDIEAKKVILDEAELKLETAKENQTYKTKYSAANAKSAKSGAKTNFETYCKANITPLSDKVEAAKSSHDQALFARKKFEKEVAAAELEVTTKGDELTAAEEILAKATENLKKDGAAANFIIA